MCRSMIDIQSATAENRRQKRHYMLGRSSFFAPSMRTYAYVFFMCFWFIGLAFSRAWSVVKDYSGLWRPPLVPYRASCVSHDCTITCRHRRIKVLPLRGGSMKAPCPASFTMHPTVSVSIAIYGRDSWSNRSLYLHPKGVLNIGSSAW